MNKLFSLAVNLEKKASRLPKISDVYLSIAVSLHSYVDMKLVCGGRFQKQLVERLQRLLEYVSVADSLPVADKEFIRIAILDELSEFNHSFHGRMAQISA